MIQDPGRSSAIRIAAILGTTRPDNYTGRALSLAIEAAQELDDVQVDLIEPASMHLPFPGQEGDFPDAAELRRRVAAATGVIIATPEYHGSFSALLKLIIENLGFPSALAGKPVSLLGVAAGRIGAVKSLEHLRGVCSHVGAIVLPGPVSVAGVRKVFDTAGATQDEAVATQIRGVVTNLLEYIRGAICPRIAFEQIVREGTE